jgi:hypothetical protein
VDYKLKPSSSQIERWSSAVKRSAAGLSSPPLTRVINGFISERQNMDGKREGERDEK